MSFGVTREKSSSFELIYFEPKIRVELELEPGLEPISIWNDKELISIKRKIKIIVMIPYFPAHSHFCCQVSKCFLHYLLGVIFLRN